MRPPIEPDPDHTGGGDGLLKTRVEQIFRPIETKRLKLRQWNEADLAPFASMNVDVRVREFFPGLLTCEESNASIDRYMDKLQSDGFTFWAAEEKSTGEFIGLTGLMRVEFEAAFAPCVEIGWRLMPRFWKRGFATEAAQAALRYGFKTLHLPEIAAFAAHSNQASLRVMQRIGMTRDVDFIHPNMPSDHSLQPCTLYRMKQSNWLPSSTPNMMRITHERAC